MGFATDPLTVGGTPLDPGRLPVRERILSAYDQHPNALGHRLLADGILARLRSSGVLSLASAPDG